MHERHPWPAAAARTRITPTHSRHWIPSPFGRGRGRGGHHDNIEAARPGGKQVPILIYFRAGGCPLLGFCPGGRVEEHPTVGNHPVVSDIIGQPRRPIGVNIGDIQSLFVWREGNAVGCFDVLGEQRQRSR